MGRGSYETTSSPSVVEGRSYQVDSGRVYGTCVVGFRLSPLEVCLRIGRPLLEVVSLRSRY